MAQSLPIRAPGSSEESTRALDDLRRLLQQGRLDEARGLLADLHARNVLESRALEHWTRVLRPPRAYVGGPGKGGAFVAENGAWLRENNEKYTGQWVALRKGVLLGANPSHAELYRELERRNELSGALFFRLTPA
jgi:hypothetical protein